ncbi:MAG: hypothetical protein EOL93_11125 [Epsilonproteobacteria bacterium]|nr:hypothetical protein [Campylobacterota bacterium]
MDFVRVSCTKCIFNADFNIHQKTPFKCPLCGNEVNNRIILKESKYKKERVVEDVVANSYAQSRMSENTNDDIDSDDYDYDYDY